MGNQEIIDADIRFREEEEFKLLGNYLFGVLGERAFHKIAFLESVDLRNLSVFAEVLAKRKEDK